MTVPMGFVRGNLPAGLQILGRPRSSAKHMLTLPVGVDGGATGPHVVRMRRSIRIANPLVPAAERSRGPAFAITEFATDSPLEGSGFELPVPREIGSVLTLNARPPDRQQRHTGSLA